MIIQNKKSGFSIIEVLIGMFIFSLWTISIYAIISSSVRINEYNKNYIIASNLAREQLELMRNNRDYNYEKLQKFDQINPPLLNQENPLDDFSNVFLDDTFYTIENNIWGLTFPITIKQLSTSDVWDDETYRLCLDDKNMYIYCPVWTSFKKTVFFKYIHIDKLDTNTLKITSKVIWKSRGLHEFEVKTILADWKQL